MPRGAGLAPLVTNSPPGRLPPALAEAANLMRANPAETEARARAFLSASPGHRAARMLLVNALRAQGHAAEAMNELNVLLEGDPRNCELLGMKAGMLVRTGDYAGAIACHDEMLKERPGDSALWLAQGHMLRTLGKRDEAIAAYRKSIALRPGGGEAYWSLANLKTLRLTSADMDAMRAQLARPDLADADRAPLHFALARAYEDSSAYDEAFANYVKGNALWKQRNAYSADDTSAFVRRSKAALTPALFQKRAGVGSLASGPIFIVGLPRSGSTLVEQILASHSAVEATAELIEIMAFAARMGGDTGNARTSAYPEILATLDGGAIARLGDEYVARTRAYRKRNVPRFTDKMPNNFLHVGLIRLILPHAKIVDVRRHPLGCCVSNFRQFFPRGQAFTNSLTDIGRYYRDYVELMAHWDAALPGTVHRVFYENLVENPQAEIRRLLEYCGLGFEESCLRFYENDRAILTPSSEQVRQPVFTEGLDHWRHYEPWLAPLKQALGPVLEGYPSIPEF